MADYRYYLGPLVWDATEDAPCWRAPNGVVGMVDLGAAPDMARPGSDRPVAFLASTAELGSSWTLLDRGDLRDITVTAAMQSAWESVAGYKPAGDRLVDLLWDHLTNGADAEGESACLPLVPTVANVLELWLPGHSLVRHEKFRWGQHSHTAKLKALLQRDLMSVRDQATSGKMRGKQGKDVEFHRRVAQSLCEKYRIEFEAVRPAKWPKDEKPLVHSTTYTENFNGSDGAALGIQLTWTEVAGAWSNASNKGYRTGDQTIGAARAEHDMSSSDTYAQISAVSITTSSGSNNLDAATRFSSSAHNAYTMSLKKRATGVWEVYLQKITAGSETTLDGPDTVTPTLPNTLKVSANGSTIKGYREGVEAFSLTDTAIASGTRSGLADSWAPTSSSATFDDFECGDLAASGQPARKRFGGVPFAALNRGVW